MKLELFDEHTLDAERLTPGGFVLDAGARNFRFSREVAARGCRVIALDADPTIDNPNIAGVTFVKLGLVAESAADIGYQIVMSDDPQARHLVPLVIGGGSKVIARVTTIERIMRVLGVSKWDAVKLDIEGSEYEILRTWPGPVSSQVSVEFHEHITVRSPELHREIRAHLSQWYDTVQDNVESRHCTHPNRWDSLWTLR